MIERRPLRADIRDEVVARLVRGELLPGDRINESRLAEDLDVSRTPLREALICLVQQELLASSLGRGFRVPRLVAREVAEIGSVLRVLEPPLVADLVPAPADLLVDLGNQLSRIRLAQQDPTRVTAHLYRFSAVLARFASNRHLGRVVLLEVERTLRYLRAAVATGWSPVESLARFQEMVDALRSGDREAAAAAVRAGRETFIRALEAQGREVE